MQIEIVSESPECVPEYATGQAAGMDLKANEELVLQPGERAAVATGIRVAIPAGYEGQIRARSGLALKHGICVPNAPGTVDADYRGEVKVLLMNLGSEAFEISRGDRIAQLVICRVERAQLKFAEGLGATQRGEDGFGSTGI